MGVSVSILASDLSVSGAGRWGGAVRPFLLAQALRQLGCQVELVGFTFNGELGIVSTPELPVKWIAAGRYPEFWRSANQLRQCIDGDIIYAYKPKPSSFGVALLDKLQTRRPVLLDIDDWELSWHGGDEWRYRPSLRQVARDVLKPDGALRNPDHPLFLRWMEKLVARADVVTTHTHFLQRRFGGVLVPNGKDTDLFNPARYDAIALKEKYGLSPYTVLMFPGAPRPYKGVEDVLMAFDRLQNPSLRLVIVGGSPYDDYDSRLIERWGQWIIKLPKLPYAQMPEAIAAADVIVVPQRDTPAAQAQFPLKLTDGMAMAKPVLATRVGDIPAILGDTGYLVDSEAPEQIAEQINRILSQHEEAVDRGQKARLRCIHCYSIDAMAQALATEIGKYVSVRVPPQPGAGNT